MLLLDVTAGCLGHPFIAVFAKGSNQVKYAIIIIIMLLKSGRATGKIGLGILDWAYSGIPQKYGQNGVGELQQGTSNGKLRCSLL